MQSSATKTVTRSRRNKDKKAKVFYWSMLILPLLQFVIFYIVVNFNSVLMAFQEINATTYETKFSFENFTMWFSQAKWPTLVTCFKNSFKYFLVTLCTIPVSLLISYYIFKKFRFHQFFKIIAFIPSIICISAFAIMYKMFVNYGMQSIFGEGNAPISTVATEYRSLMLMVFYVLMCFSGNILLYINAMSAVNPSVIESAKIDGAGEFRVFMHVVIPQIWGTIVSLLVIFMAGIVTNQAYLYNFFGRTASTELMTVGYFIFSNIADSVPNVELLYYQFSGLGLMLTLVLAPLTILARHLLTKYGPRED